MIYQGAIIVDIFVDFVIEKVLPHCEAYPNKWSVIILDNATIHKDL